MEARVLRVLAALFLLAGIPARADQDPRTDNVGNLLPYAGLLEKDGATVSGPVEMKLSLYDGPETVSGPAPPVLWAETQVVQVFNGRFSVLLGLCDQLPVDAACPDGDADTALAIQDVLLYADDLHLGIILYPRSTSPVPLQNRKRLLPVPYAAWSRAAADLRVARNLAVGGTLNVDNVLSAGVEQATSGARVIAFAQDPGDEASAGKIVYRGFGTPALSIVGAGNNPRVVKIWDDLQVQRNIVLGGGGTINAQATWWCDCEHGSELDNGTNVPDYWSGGDQGSAYYQCRGHRFLVGMWFNCNTSVTCVEQFKCCRPCALVGN